MLVLEFFKEVILSAVMTVAAILAMFLWLFKTVLQS